LIGSALSSPHLAPFSRLASFGSAPSFARLQFPLALLGSVPSACSPRSAPLSHLASFGLRHSLGLPHSVSSPHLALFSQLTSFASTLSVCLIQLRSQLATFSSALSSPRLGSPFALLLRCSTHVMPNIYCPAALATPKLSISDSGHHKALTAIIRHSRPSYPLPHSDHLDRGFSFMLMSHKTHRSHGSHHISFPHITITTRGRHPSCFRAFGKKI